jgi:hypothetical protein
VILSNREWEKRKGLYSDEIIGENSPLYVPLIAGSVAAATKRTAVWNYFA